jgi:plasmid stabilization system protein ParE
MTFRVFISPQARRDIDRNADWWAAHHSVEQAFRWLEAVYDQLETLAEFPEANGLSAENHAFPFEIRDKLVGLGARLAYRAVFTIRGDAVLVLTVRRSSQDSIRPDEIDPPPLN